MRLAKARRRSLVAIQTGVARYGFLMNYLLVESLQRFHHYYGEDFKIEYPTGSGKDEEPERDCGRSFRSDGEHLQER